MNYLSSALFIAASCFTVTAYADNDSAKANFSPAQKVAIEQIVHNYLITHPEVLVEVGEALQLKQQAMMQEKANKIIPALAASLMSDPNSPVVGNLKGKVSVIEFFDYQCPHCKVMASEIDALIKSNPNVRVVYKELPIFGAESEFAAKAALASQRQGKFVAFHNALLNSPGRLPNQTVLDIAKSVGLDVNKLQADMNLPEYNQEIQSTGSLANKIGLTGTPGFIIITVSPTGQVRSQFIPGQTNKDALLKGVNTLQQS